MSPYIIFVAFTLICSMIDEDPDDDALEYIDAPGPLLASRRYVAVDTDGELITVFIFDNAHCSMIDEDANDGGLESIDAPGPLLVSGPNVAADNIDNNGVFISVFIFDNAYCSTIDPFESEYTGLAMTDPSKDLSAFADGTFDFDIWLRQTPFLDKPDSNIDPRLLAMRHHPEQNDTLSNPQPSGSRSKYRNISFHFNSTDVQKAAQYASTPNTSTHVPRESQCQFVSDDKLSTT